MEPMGMSYVNDGQLVFPISYDKLLDRFHMVDTLAHVHGSSEDRGIEVHP
jgi:hypothetical protein